MLYYTQYDVVTTEIPDEISLAFSVYGCPIHCKGCHSPELWDTSPLLSSHKHKLTSQVIKYKLKQQQGVTCVLFLGGEWDIYYLYKLCVYVKLHECKTALYSGHDLNWFLDKEKGYTLIHILDYLKVGQYKEELGGLQSKTTNQRLLSFENQYGEDITYKFWR